MLQFAPILIGAVAQLGERLVRNEKVVGSIPISSTNLIAGIRKSFCEYLQRDCSSSGLGHSFRSVSVLGFEPMPR